jgi:hypothetical protein
MPHSYRFADPAHTIIERDDGARIVWPPGENIANINGGRLAEDFRRDGGHTRAEPYRLRIEPKVSAVLTAVKVGRRDLGLDGARQIIEALAAAGLSIVETPRPCR